jgi:hypothetical protein
MMMTDEVIDQIVAKRRLRRMVEQNGPEETRRLLTEHGCTFEGNHLERMLQKAPISSDVIVAFRKIDQQQFEQLSLLSA